MESEAFDVLRQHRLHLPAESERPNIVGVRTRFRVNRTGHFEPFYSVHWPFWKLFGYSTLIPSGHPAPEPDGGKCSDGKSGDDFIRKLQIAMTKFSQL